MANLRKWILALAIAIVFNFFINYGVSLFYPQPQYNDFCGAQGIDGRYPVPAKAIPLETQQTACQTVAPSTELQNSCNDQKGYISYKYNATGCPTEAYCELCQKQFDEINQARNSNVFIVLLVAGILAMVLGLTLRADAVSSGFLLGGLLSLIIAAVRTWGQLQNIFKLAIIGAVLILLIWLGYKKTSENSASKQKK